VNGSQPLFLAALLLYFLSAGLYAVPMLVRGAATGRIARTAALFGFLAHSAAIVERAIALGHAPYVELREAVATIAWVIVLLTLVVEGRRKPTALGARAMPLAGILIFMADALPVFGQTHPLIPALYENPLKAHIGATVAGFGAFALAFCAALLYLVQERRLKEKRARPGEPGSMSLVEIEQVANMLAAFGFAMLSLGLLLGVIWAGGGLWHGRWYTEPIVLATLATWVVYAVYLYRRGVRGARGRANMYFLIAGFALAICTVLLVRVVAPGRHAF
jgi:ABC-type transport system involved in cytochrome c biogenesis permease subunit